MQPSKLQHLVAERSSELYDSTGPRTDKVRNWFRQLPAGRKILDVGCATGQILAPLVGTHDVYGVDISESLISYATKAGLKAQVHDVETGPLPFPDKSFDVVFCGEAIEHHVDTDWLLSELNRVIRPGGRLVLTFPNVRTVLGLAMLAFFDLPPMYAARYRSPHFRDFTLRTIKMALANHRFSVDQAMGSSFFLPKVGEFGSGLANFFPSWANTVIVIGTKQADSSYDSQQSVGELDL